jgi:ribulose-phosphate 3-epimerase
MDIKINPSVMCADLSRLGEQIEELDAAGVDMFHWDIMDGVYVHNLALSPAVMAACRRYTRLPFDVHLGLVDPASYIPDAAASGADIISLQFENTPHVFRAVRQIHALGKKAGVVINPITPIDMLEPLVSELDMVTLMTVDFGFAGQSIIWPVLEKARTLRRWTAERGLVLDIQVDGQVNAPTIAPILASGANVLVVGTSGLFTLAPTLAEGVSILQEQIAAAQPSETVEAR